LVADSLHVAIRVYSFARFIGIQIDRQIDWLVAKFARHF
jgi:hypothetical protein